MVRCSTMEVTMAIRLASLLAIAALLLPTISTSEHQKLASNKQTNKTSKSNTTTTAARAARAISLQAAESNSMPSKIILMGDSIGLDTAIESHRDLTPAAGEHKKYILVKKKPKHKKIKMEVYKPKMKYKKIKMKVPVKKMKKKKVKGYLVKKEHHH